MSHVHATHDGELAALDAMVLLMDMMSGPPHSPDELKTIYSNRFDEHLTYRNEVWQVLTSEFFSRLISSQACVLDLGCGYGEFINNIKCAQKYAMDMNPDAAQRLASGITFIEQDCSHEWGIPECHLDAVFTSNFFEHLESKFALSNTLTQARRCLKPGGLIIAMARTFALRGAPTITFR